MPPGRRRSASSPGADPSPSFKHVFTLVSDRGVAAGAEECRPNDAILLVHLHIGGRYLLCSSTLQHDPGGDDAVSSTVSDRGAGAPPRRLSHLDGVRSTAALYVLVHHAFMSAHLVDGHGAVHGWESIAFGWAQWGHFGVTVFIALAGFSLGMPVGRAGGLPDGFWGFLRRRARRIVPPYWIALTITILLAAGPWQPG